MGKHSTPIPSGRPAIIEEIPGAQIRLEQRGGATVLPIIRILSERPATTEVIPGAQIRLEQQEEATERLVGPTRSARFDVTRLTVPAGADVEPKWWLRGRARSRCRRRGDVAGPLLASLPQSDNSNELRGGGHWWLDPGYVGTGSTIL